MIPHRSAVRTPTSAASPVFREKTDKASQERVGTRTCDAFFVGVRPPVREMVLLSRFVYGADIETTKKEATFCLDALTKKQSAN